jgi:hypothetical protein
MAKARLLDRSPIHLLHRAIQAAADIFAAEMKDDLTPRQLAVLVTVANNEGLSQRPPIQPASTAPRSLTS